MLPADRELGQLALGDVFELERAAALDAEDTLMSAEQVGQQLVAVAVQLLAQLDGRELHGHDRATPKFNRSII
ncbi:hypothetical protein [Streptomyces rimosus]